MTAFQIVGVVLGWRIGDRFDKRLHRRRAACCAHALGLLLLTYAVPLAMLVAFAVLHGIAWGLRGPFMQAIRADYFGRSAIGMILGLSFMIIMIGQVGGPMIPAIFADTTGDYRLGFTIIAVLAGLGSVFFVLAKKPKAPQGGGGGGGGGGVEGGGIGGEGEGGGGGREDEGREEGWLRGEG